MKNNIKNSKLCKALCKKLNAKTIRTITLAAAALTLVAATTTLVICFVKSKK